MTAPSATFLAETHERFLKAVVAQLPVERIIELHLFPSIKQGGVESGVAVVAAVPEGEVAVGGGRREAGGEGADAVTPAPEQSAVDEGASEVAAEADDAAAGASISAGEEADPVGPPPKQQDEAPATGEPHPYDAGDIEPTAGIADATDAGNDAEDGGDASPLPPPAALEIGDTEAPVEIDAEEAERLEDAVHEVLDDVEDPAAQAMAAASLELGDLPAAETPRRYTIYSARYRLVLKGPDRGKWAVDIVAQADAPLVTVESVVRGVQRRAGDADEVGRWTGEELRAALRLPAPGA